MSIKASNMLVPAEIIGKMEHAARNWHVKSRRLIMSGMMKGYFIAQDELNQRQMLGIEALEMELRVVKAALAQYEQSGEH